MGSAASVVDSHPLLPTPVIPSSAVRLEPVVSWLAGWLGRGKKGRRRRGGEKAGTAALGKATLRPPEMEGVARQREGMAQLTYIPILPRAQPGRPTAMTRLGCCSDRGGVWSSCPSVSCFESGLACG